jgi:DNA-binding NtrC family response regulator
MSSSRYLNDESKTRTDAAAPECAKVLVYWDGGSATCELPRAGSLTIGRSQACEIRIDHASVSRKHAILHVSSTIEVEDLGSSNGTRVAAKRLPPHTRVPLRRGELAEIGLASLIIQGRERVGGASTLTSRSAPTGGKDAGTMERLYRLVDSVAASSISVILQGETGVGKEVMAEAIHARSPRRASPLVRIHCAAMPEALLESELFGFERGAFTGAVQAKQGLLETADGGTLLLDEIGEVPPLTQAKLLRVLEAREVWRLGALKPRPVDVRLLAATNRNLEECVIAGTFRRDLYYRLNGITITIPPLRDRKGEIPALVRDFVRALAPPGAAPPNVPKEVIDLLLRHDWPGNIRELKNVIERSLVLARGGPVLARHLSLPVAAQAPEVNPNSRPLPVDIAPRAPAASPEDLRRELETLERQRILEALERTGGNQTRAAKLLNIPRRTLLARLDAYGVPRPRKREDDPRDDGD